jgi:thioredoxin-related protein
MSYPTTIFLDEKFGMLSPVPGFQTTEQLMPILYFFGENYYKNMKWDEYQTYLQKQNGGAGGAK